MFFAPLAPAVRFSTGIFEGDQVAPEEAFGANERGQPRTHSSFKGRQVRSRPHEILLFSYILRIYKIKDNVKLFSIATLIDLTKRTYLVEIFGDFLKTKTQFTELL
jgi:hypothetical protein